LSGCGHTANCSGYEENPVCKECILNTSCTDHCAAFDSPLTVTWKCTSECKSGGGGSSGGTSGSGTSGSDGTSGSGSSDGGATDGGNPCDTCMNECTGSGQPKSLCETICNAACIE
jgi:hypothetical protein